MQNRRFIAELVLVALFVTLLAWQQLIIGALRQDRPAVASGKPSTVTMLFPQESVRRRADGVAAGSRRTQAATGATSDLAVLQAENQALRQQLEAVGVRQQQADYVTTMLTAEGMLSEGLTSSYVDDQTRPPDTTGSLPTGEAASWSHRQAVGAPDTAGAGDMVTAWASRSPDGGEEWLHLSYERPVDITQINVHETYNPGAVSRISAVLPDGSEKTVWEGTEPPEQAPVEVAFPVPAGVRSDQIKVYMDTARVAGWNEVDAVELVGSDGSRQWASGSSASSYYGDRR